MLILLFKGSGGRLHRFSSSGNKLDYTPEYLFFKFKTWSVSDAV